MLSNETFSLSVVVPAYNEEVVLPEFHRRVCHVLNSLDAEWEIIYVNDGSTDNTLNMMTCLKEPQVAVIDLSRNFGKEIAMAAGLATLKELDKPEIYDDLGSKTNWLMGEMEGVLKKFNVPYTCQKIGSMFGFFFIVSPVFLY